MVIFNREYTEWNSVIELLVVGETAATLATAIEEKGVYTFDRFGRLITAIGDDEADKYSKAYALSEIARVYAAFPAGCPELEDLGSTIDIDAEPLLDFGWPKNVMPDLSQYRHQNSKQTTEANSAAETPLGTRLKATYLIVIAALFRLAKLDHNDRGMAKKIQYELETMGIFLSDDTIRDKLREIDPAVRDRSSR